MHTKQYESVAREKSAEERKEEKIARFCVARRTRVPAGAKHSDSRNKGRSPCLYDVRA